MIIAGIYGTGFIVLGALLAFWSLWWIVRAAMTDPIERTAEDVAREAVGRGEGWPDERGPGGTPRRPFTDDEMVELSQALHPSQPDDVGVGVREKTEAEKREKQPRNKR